MFPFLLKPEGINPQTDQLGAGMKLVLYIRKLFTLIFIRGLNKEADHSDFVVVFTCDFMPNNLIILQGR